MKSRISVNSLARCGIKLDAQLSLTAYKVIVLALWVLVHKRRRQDSATMAKVQDILTYDLLIFNN
jgi:hypothetical protein